MSKLNLDYLEEAVKQMREIRGTDTCFNCLMKTQTTLTLIQTIRAYERAIEKVVWMDVTDCEEGNCLHECSKRNPLWRSKRDLILQQLEEELKKEV